MKYTISEAQEAAASLYDGGWRANDKEELMEEHGLDNESAEMICKELECYSEREKNK